MTRPIATPHNAAEMLVYIDAVVALYGEDAWAEVEWYYRHTPAGEIHAVVDAVTYLQFQRGQYLDDPVHAAYLFHDETFAATFDWAELQAERVDDEARELVRSFIASHELTVVTS